MWSWQKSATLTALVVGMGAGMGIHASAQAQIVIGQTAGFSGIVASGVQETTDGAKLYLDNVNARGGVGGQKIELVSLDDKFDPKLAGENARKLIEEQNVTALFLTRGTPHNEAIIPHLDKHGVPLIGPSTGAMVLHKPVPRHVFNVRATYQREAEKAITHLASLGVTRIAVVQADDSFGADGMAGAKRGFELAKLTPVLQEKFDRSKPDFSPISSKLKESQAQATLMLASGSAVVDGYAAFRKVGYGGQIVQVFPGERSGNFAMVREAHDLAKAKGKEISPAMLEGFAAAKVLVEGLKRAGPKPTREKLVAALETMQKVDLGGLEISYSPTDHTGLDFADLSIIGTDGKFRR